MQSLPINQNKVNALIKQCKHLNVFPIFLSYYYPATEPNPVSDLLTELIEEAVQYLSIMTNGEIEALVDSFPPGVKMFVERGSASNEFLASIALYYLVVVVQANYISLKQIISGDTSQSEVIKTYPELEAKLDFDGLLVIDDNFKLFDGGIAYKDHILHYHQFLRREFSSNPNFDFLRRFIRYYISTRSKNEFRIAIDHHRLMPREFFRHIGEMDAWFGPLFDRSKLDDPYAVGLTIVKRIRPSIFDMTNRLDRTEFYWSYKDGVKTFEVEEISSGDYSFDSYFLNRYAHGERDIQQQILRHFDGAVKVYLQSDYSARLASQMPSEKKSHKKIKLFRIDGNIDIEEWTELLALFFKGNEMLIEYFNPEQFEEKFGERLRRYRSSKSMPSDSD